MTMKIRILLILVVAVTTSGIRTDIPENCYPEGNHLPHNSTVVTYKKCNTKALCHESIFEFML